MKLDLSDEQAGLLIKELDEIIDRDRYPYSYRIRALKEVLGKLRPEPVRKPLPPPPKVYAPPRIGAAKRRRAVSLGY